MEIGRKRRDGHSGLSRRMRFAVRTTPDLKRYGEVARETGATLGTLVSSMVPYLLSQATQRVVPIRFAGQRRKLTQRGLTHDISIAFRIKFAQPTA